ncbi:MAG: efflux RND transporter periplasmic adaptor subunit [Thiotrichales bacterium]
MFRVRACFRRSFGCVALLSLLTVAGCSGPGEDAPKAGGGGPGAMPPLPVTVLAAAPTEVPVTIEAVAQTEGAKEVEVRARVGGILLKQDYREGQEVAAGAPLFQIDPATYRLVKQQAQARVVQAQAQAAQAQRDLKRMQELVTTKAVSRKEVDDAQSTLDIAKATVLVAEVALKEAELNLDYSEVRAPIRGIAGRSTPSIGALINTTDNSLLTTLVQIDPIRVNFGLAPSEIAKLPGGRVSPEGVEKVELILPDGSTYAAAGKLDFVAAGVDPSLGTLQLRAEFPNPERQLLPGQFVRARLHLGQRDGIFQVPQNAVIENDKGRFVFVVGADNTAQMRPVELGAWYGKDWIVTGGLQAGDQVIIDNLMKLRPGAAVNPRTPGVAPGEGQQAPAGAPPKPATDPSAKAAGN